MARTNREAAAAGVGISGSCSPAAAGQHAVDEPDVDDLGVQGAAAGVLDRVGAVAAHQPQQPVDLAHLGPRQRMLQHRRGIGADVGAVRGCLALQGVRSRIA